MFGLAPEYLTALGQGVLMTLWLTIASGFLSLVLGIILGVMRSAPLGIVRSIAAGYTEFFRNIPLLTVLLFLYFFFGGKYAGFTVEPVTTAILAFGVYTAAYVAEVVRAGLSTVSRGNIEAARSQGMSFLQSMRHVQLPQAIRVAVPPLGTLLIALLKNTSLAYTISVGEIFFQGTFVEARTFNPIILPMVGAMYVALTLPTGALVNYIERKWAIQR
jgi:His/Glu/Gln/Arg/opine family amino acid ABC transporter permease subunit